MPSKLARTAARSTMSEAMGCVDGSWSWRYAHVFSMFANDAHTVSYFVASSVASVLTYSANDSLSQRSSHQRIVTRSPNHMCAISCSNVTARRSYDAAVTLERKT